MAHLVIPPWPSLAPHLKHFMIDTVAGGEIQFTAQVNAQLVVFTRGSSVRVEADGRRLPAPPAIIAGPTLSPYRGLPEPGTTFIAVLFRDGSFGHFFDLPLSTIAGGFVDLADLVPAQVVADLVDAIRNTAKVSEQLTLLQCFLLACACAREGRARHVMPQLASRHCTLPAAALASQFGVGVRQFERKFTAAYGMSLRDYRRLARFREAFAWVMSHPLQRGWITRLAQDAGYFDQAHLDREFRALVGFSPSDYAAGTSPDNSILRLVRDYSFQELANLFL